MQNPSETWQTLLSAGARDLGMNLSAAQIAQFTLYAQELVLWNKKINITAITDPEEIAVKHFLDAIACALEIHKTSNLIDIGSGGGFPGIPLKLVIPSLSVTLIDASRKKVNFLKHIIRTLKLSHVDAVHIRAEDMAMDDAFKSRFDIAVSRAFSNLDRFVELASPLVKPGGTLIAMKGRKAAEEAAAYTGKPKPVLKAYHLPFLEADRWMVIFLNHS